MDVRSERCTAGVLDDVEDFVGRYVVMGGHEKAAVAVWVAHTHAIGAADTTPYLAVTSDEKRAGKTRLLEVLELIVADPLRVSSISEAALVRAVSERPATLLFDEVDAVFTHRGAREGMRGLLNAGYRRGSRVVRNEKVGECWIPRSYDPFGAKALAAIGRLPDTVADRAIAVRMVRRDPDQPVERFRYREVHRAARPLRRELALWGSEDVVGLLRQARPRIPEGIDDRAADGWEPLLAIADLAGSRWGSRVRAAAASLARSDAGTPAAR